MEVVPTSDGGEDDGVIWFRCPQCQGFLPKLSGAALEDDTAEPAVDDGAADSASVEATSTDAEDDAMPWDSPADMMAAQQEAVATGPAPPSPFLPEDEAALGDDLVDDPEILPGGPEIVTESTSKKSPKPAVPAEPIHEYAAMLAALDVSDSTPYRPWESYHVGQCIHHLAWDDCGVVVAKEDLPGGRKIIKCYFEEAGVVRLIEQAPR